jgi:hypothetical protein
MARRDYRSGKQVRQLHFCCITSARIRVGFVMSDDTEWIWRLPSCLIWTDGLVIGQWRAEETVFCEARHYQPAWWNMISSLAPAVSCGLIFRYVQSCTLGRERWFTHTAVVGLMAAMLANAASSLWYHYQSTRLGRMWDNLSLQMGLWWLACATVGQVDGQTDNWSAWFVYLFAGWVFVQTWLVGCWYLVYPDRTAMLLAIGIVVSAVFYLMWTWRLHPMLIHPGRERRRWWMMTTATLTAAGAYYMDVKTCSSTSFYWHGIFHVALAAALFWLVPFLLPPHPPIGQHTPHQDNKNVF